MATNTRKQRSVLVLSAFLLLLAVGTAGCTSDKDPAVATADPGAAQVSAGPAGNGERSPVKFSQCMREQGLTWYPDPDADGGLKVRVPPGTDQSKLDKAEKACKAYAPWEGQQSRQISAEDLDKLRKVSECMRDHGFAKYPDPDANGSIKIDSQVLGVEPDDPTFEKARQGCEKYMPVPRSKGNP